ncbi:MAG: hypothetical protein DMF51_15150 [Acidobacteria bacterium]|nr:MAG: hypothetical protein DMF51_15150 [Acidobacteriota bacterium]
MTPPATLSAGTRLGPYEILAAIGAGGMGEVYRARDTQLGRDVAIKIVSEALAADPEHRARFEREARLLASVDHPNVAAIHGIEEQHGLRFLVLELVEGTTLDEIDRRRARGGARPGSHPPGPEARERTRDAGRQGEGPRFRSGEERRGSVALGLGVRHRHRRPDRGRRHPRHTRLHESGAGARQTPRSAQRRLVVRVSAVRDARRSPGVRR